MEPGKDGKKKSFFQRRPDGNGGWINNLEGIPQLPYRLSELASASSVFIVEGEKDVDALFGIGLTATCNSGGAGKWCDDHAQYLRADHHVTIIPDNDDAGRRHAQQVAQSLCGKVASLKILELPNLSEKGDVSDWLATRPRPDAASELSKLAEASEPWEPTSAAGGDAFSPPSYWKRLDLAELHTWQVEPLRPLIDGIVAHGNLVYVAAETQTGKTLLLLYIARSLLAPVLLFGKFKITPVERILYLVLEDPDRRIQSRLADIENEFGSELVAHDACVFQVAPGFNLGNEDMFRWLESVIHSERRQVVFLDTYQKATPGLTSFDDEAQSLILHKLSDLTRKLPITLFIVDHVRKKDAKSRRKDLNIDDIKGTGGKAQNADCVILLERTPDRTQVKFQAFSKDFDIPVRVLLNVSPQGSRVPKFTYAGDLDGVSARGQAKAFNQGRILAAMPEGDWVSVPTLAKSLTLGSTTVQNYIKELLKAQKVRDNGAKGRWRQYQRIANSATIESGAVAI